MTRHVSSQAETIQTESPSGPGQQTWVEEVCRVAAGIRRRVLEHVLRNKGGYLSQACSAAEILATLYLRIMKLGPVPEPLLPGPFPGVPGPTNPNSARGWAFNGPREAGLDRFILSPSQYALILYAALVELGRMGPAGLGQFNQDGSTVEMIGAEHSPGHEIMSGSLGQGLSQASGMAWARRRRGDTGKVWVFMSDGEFQSGQTWETFQTAAFHRLDHLAIVVDVNGQQCDGRMETVMNVEPLDRRLEAFGVCVRRVNGHDVTALAAAAEADHADRPLAILADTDPCRGVEILRARAPKLHYLRFKDDAELTHYREFFERMR